MKRRTILAASAASVVTVSGIGAPFIARAQAQIDRSKLTKTLRFSSYGGSWQEGITAAAIKPFEEKYGVQVLQESHGSEAQLIAKMKASGAGAYDVVTVNESGLYLGVKQDVFDPLRLENIPNFANVVKVLQKPRYDPGPGVHSIPDVYGSTAIVYNTKHVEKPTGLGRALGPEVQGSHCRARCRHLPRVHHGAQAGTGSEPDFRHQQGLRRPERAASSRVQVLGRHLRDADACR